MRALVVSLALVLAAPAVAQPTAPASAPAGDCPYPVLFLHGYTGSQRSWDPFLVTEPDVAGLWGPRADVFHAVLNAYENEERIAGPDGVLDTPDDDVLIHFANEDNTMAPGCLYAINFENWWNEDPANPLLEVNGGGSPGGLFASESDSNEEAAMKQGYAVGRMVGRVLAANPGKDRVVLVGHSMGGLAAREYLQRRTEAGAPAWWVEPDAPGGHRVARLLTVSAPHRGSNFFGNPFLQDDDPAPPFDGTPDINASATRDLRYNYFCLFCSSPGPYLFSGREGNGIGWHTDDINLDGDEDDTIVGINVDGRDQGFDDPWDGTTDNPAMPLPRDVRYTWLTSDVGSSGDLVVDLQRQWLFDGPVPAPSNGTPYALTDTLLTDVYHLDLQEDTDAVVRGLDEPDTPDHAYRIAPGRTYAGTATVRSAGVPDGAPTRDPDWYVLETSGRGVHVALAPTPGLSGRLDVFTGLPDGGAGGFAPDPLLGSRPFDGSGAAVAVRAATAPGTHYVRVTHAGVGPSDWRQPYRLTVTAAAPPVRPTTRASAAAFGLDRPAPNPVRDRTQIRYALAAPGDATLAVFDALGRRVAVLAEGPHAAGAHRATFEAGGLPAGVYLVRLDAGAEAAVQRVVLAR